MATVPIAPSLHVPTGGWKPTSTNEERAVDHRNPGGALFQTINELKAIKPSYVSVTYGAGGSTRAKTVTLTERIQREIGLRATQRGHEIRHLGLREMAQGLPDNVRPQPT